MGVPRESFCLHELTGSLEAGRTVIERLPAGDWRVRTDITVDLCLPDGRVLQATRTIVIGGIKQRGRKPQTDASFVRQAQQREVG